MIAKLELSRENRKFVVRGRLFLFCPQSYLSEDSTQTYHNWVNDISKAKRFPSKDQAIVASAGSAMADGVEEIVVC